jgi:hypothetical protein
MDDTPGLTISSALYQRFEAFFPIMEAVFGENTHADELSELVVTRGLDTLLAEVVQGGPQASDPTLASYLAMSRDNPKYVFEFVAKMVKEGSGLKDWWQSVLGQ